MSEKLQVAMATPKYTFGNIIKDEDAIGKVEEVDAIVTWGQGSPGPIVRILYTVRNGSFVWSIPEEKVTRLVSDV